MAKVIRSRAMEKWLKQERDQGRKVKFCSAGTFEKKDIYTKDEALIASLEFSNQ